MANFRQRFILSSIVVASLAIAGCSGAGTVFDGASGSDKAASTTTAAPKLAPQASVKDGATDVPVTNPVTVTSRGDGLSQVTMVNEEGKEVESELSADGMTWTTAEQLGMNRTYTIEAADKNGKTSTVSFSTTVPAVTTTLSMAPLDDSTVGVGQTIALRFGDAIQDRHAVQDNVTIETTPHVDGAFYWITPYEVRWRPAEFWEPGTKVSVKTSLYGHDLGGGVYSDTDNDINFTIGDRVVAIVDDNTKQMEVWKNRELLRTIPVSLGRNSADFATPNGWYIIGDQYPSLIMDSTTFGLPYSAGGYRTDVNYATQMSYSGIYVHAAPWSVWAQGNTNTSHGCVNVSTANAQWFQDTVKRGDVVFVKNTVGDVLSVSDGLGDWNMDWQQWSQGNVDQ